MAADQRDSQPKEKRDSSDSPVAGLEKYEYGHGHFFVKKSFHKPTYCHHCTDMLWGLMGQGYVCEVCNFVAHDRCLRTVVSPCSSIATNLIKNPVAHCWSEPGHFKRKFCNLCRKRLEDSLAIRCEICEYYAHIDCQDFVVSDCKECATYVPQRDLLSVIHLHHWREGNLPGNSKCLVCKKTCWSSECLAGMRCEWCGVTSHAACYKSLPAECSFGCMKEIMLPPSCLTIPRMDIPSETPIARTVSDDFGSSSGDSRHDDDERRSPKEKDGKEKDKDRDEEIVRVFDGNSSLKKRVYRTVAVPRQVPAQLLLEAALRTFHISDDPKNYYLAEVTEKESGENILDENSPLRPQLLTREGKRPSVFLRYREKDSERGYVRVYPGGLRYDNSLEIVAVSFKNIPVTKETTTHDVIEKALRKFSLEDADPNRFHLIEVLLDRGVSERQMGRDEKPLHIIQHTRKESLRQHRMTRFYLQQIEDPHGPHVAIFIGNLPTSLSQRQYEKILLDVLGKKKKVPTATLR